MNQGIIKYINGKYNLFFQDEDELEEVISKIWFFYKEREQLNCAIERQFNLGEVGVADLIVAFENKIYLYELKHKLIPNKVKKALGQIKLYKSALYKYVKDLEWFSDDAKIIPIILGQKGGGMKLKEHVEKNNVYIQETPKELVVFKGYSVNKEE